MDGQKKGHRNQRAIVPNPIEHFVEIGEPVEVFDLSNHKGIISSVADEDLEKAIASIVFASGTEIVLSFQQLRQLETQIKKYLDAPEEK